MIQRALRHFRRIDEKLFKAAMSLSRAERAAIERRLRTRMPARLLFDNVCETIIGQQLSGKAADTIYRRFEKLCGRITPKIVASKSLDDFRRAGISYAKGRALHDLSYKVSEGLLPLTKFHTMGDEEIRHRLIQVRGIGPWTAEMILMFSLGREDVFSNGDLGLQKAIWLVYNLKKLPSHDQMEKISKTYLPYRTYAAMILWRYLDTKKKRAP